MASKILYSEDAYEITVREEKQDSSLDWDYPGYIILCDLLLKDIDFRLKFFSHYLKTNAPLLLTDPDKPFASDKIINPTSAFFRPETMIIFRETTDLKEIKFNELTKILIKNNLLKQDSISLVHCKDCNVYFLGMGDTSKARTFHCSKCSKHCLDKSTKDRIVKIYSYSPEIRDLLFGSSRMKILECIIYRQLKFNIKIQERFDIIASPQIRTKNPDGSTEESNERDIVLIDKQNKIKPIVILASVSSSQDSESKQVISCKKKGIPTIFVCGKGVSELSTVFTDSTITFQNVISDPEFPLNIASYIIGTYIE